MLTKSDLIAIKNIFTEKFDLIDEKFKKISRQLKKIDSKLDLAIEYFDTKTLNHEKRISKIENHLRLSSISS